MINELILMDLTENVTGVEEVFRITVPRSYKQCLIDAIDNMQYMLSSQMLDESPDVKRYKNMLAHLSDAVRKAEIIIREYK